MALAKTLYFVTSNKNKFNEAVKIFLGSGITLVQYPLDISEYQGTSETIARQKCLDVKKHMESINNECYPFIIENAGFHMNCLNGLPGPYSKWFVEYVGLDGLVKLGQLHGNNTCYAQSIVTLMFNKTNNPLIFYGTLNGICVNPRGQNTYDWDSIFEPTKESGGNGQTYAEMPIDYKNTISQRNKALNEIKAFLCNN